MNELASYSRHYLAKVTCSTPTTACFTCFKDGVGHLENYFGVT